VTADQSIREILEATYARLRQKLESKDVSAESLRTAALDALAKAKSEVELDPGFVAQELDRLRSGQSETGNGNDQ